MAQADRNLLRLVHPASAHPVPPPADDHAGPGVCPDTLACETCQDRAWPPGSWRTTARRSAA